MVTPIAHRAGAFVGYLPNLLFVIFIAAIIRGAIRLVALFFDQIEDGRIVFTNFPAEWADPTYKIVRLLLVAFGLIVAFPYLPASDSAAFAGVSVFMGVLFSLSSSSAISNTIAGVVLTYTGAFRLGDRVKLGDDVRRHRRDVDAGHARPDDQERGHHDSQQPRARRRDDQLLAAGDGTLGLILHTSVTIGYDAPWRKSSRAADRGRARDAARPRRATAVRWQTALNDFYVTYEINAYTAHRAT